MGFLELPLPPCHYLPLFFLTCHSHLLPPCHHLKSEYNTIWCLNDALHHQGSPKHFLLLPAKTAFKPSKSDTIVVCDKWYSYCFITSNIQDFPILWFHIYNPTIFLLANLSFVNKKWFRWKEINSWFLSILSKGCTWFSMYQR